MADPHRPLRRPALLAALMLAAAACAIHPALAQDAADDAAGSERAAPTREVLEVPDGQPRYFAALEREFEAMRVRGAECEALDALRARCTFTARGLTTGREFAIRLVYSDRTDTVYLHVEDYLELAPDSAHAGPVLRRLMELNWDLLLGKFEWDSSSGEIRLAMILNTDSNFDRRAFRSAVRGIGQLADRYYTELERLSRGEAAARAVNPTGDAGE